MSHTRSEKAAAGATPASSAKPDYVRKWIPDYGRIFMDLVKKSLYGVKLAIQGIPNLKWYQIIFPPAGLYYFASLWLTGFVGIPDRTPRSGPQPWFDRYVNLVKLPTASNPKSAKTGMWWMPVSSLSWANTHGLMVRGLTHLQMFQMVALFFPQLMLASFWRCLQFHFGFGAWKPNKADNHQTYLAIVNTSLGAYYDDKEDAFVFHDVAILAKHNTGQSTFTYVKFMCDHDAGTVLHMIIKPAKTGIEMVVKDPEEISIFATQVGALMTHPQVHWWANGVNEVTQWKLHETSSKWTQFLNYLSCFQSLFFYHSTFDNDTELLTNNLMGGMPVHNNIPKQVIQWSKMHQMTSEARGLLKAHFEEVGKPISEQELNCLMCATIFHAADHHYLNKYSCRNGLSDILQSDFRVMRVCIVGGYRWLFTKFLCKQYRNVDPVSKILYDTALKHDPEFANGLLTIGIAI